MSEFKTIVLIMVRMSLGGLGSIFWVMSLGLILSYISVTTDSSLAQDTELLQCIDEFREQGLDGDEAYFRCKETDPAGDQVENLGADTAESEPKSSSGDTPPALLSEADNSDVDNSDVDWGPWLTRLQRRVESNWNPGQSGTSLRIVVVFSVSKDGSLKALSLARSSGSQTTDDDAALAAIRRSAPFEPLPAGFTGSQVQINFTFDIKVLEKSKFPRNEDLGPEFEKLADLLREEKWKEADEETRLIILRMVDRLGSNLRAIDLESLSCTEIKAIDELWFTASGGKYGFRTQVEIFTSSVVGGVPGEQQDKEVFERFGETVGWRENNTWLFYNELNFSEDHIRGHLPARFLLYQGGLLVDNSESQENALNGLSSLSSRLVDCEIFQLSE